MLEYYNNRLGVGAAWLIENNIVSEVNYKALQQRGHFRVIRRGCRNTPALIDYDSMPERFKLQVKGLLGNEPYKVVSHGQIEIRIEHNIELSNNFENYAFDDGRRLPFRRRREYYSNALILNAIHKMLNDKKSLRHSLNGSSRRRWDEISMGVQELDKSKYPHSLPVNPRRLETKYKKYLKDGWLSLIHKGYQNSNSLKINDIIKESYLLELLSSGNNLDNSQVTAIYNRIAKISGWKQITRGAVAIWRDKFNTVSYAGRRGKSAFSNNKAMQVKRSAPRYPLLYWTLDGWDVELLYQKTDGATTYHNRPTLVVVLDPCLKYPIGYAIGRRENPELIQDALRNALQHTQELFGCMYQVHQIQSDRYAYKTMKRYYDVVADKVTPARVKNAKSKVIEPYFNSINRRYCQFFSNWSGFGITTNRDRQPNVEILSKNRHSFPDFEQVCEQISGIIEKEREEKRDRYLELWSQLSDDMKHPLAYDNYLLRFGSSTSRKILLQGSGVSPTILGQRRYYDCFDLSFREHSSTHWEIRYDPRDLSKVLAVNDDGSLQYILEEKHIQHMSLAEQTDEDRKQLKRVEDFNKKQVDIIIERRAESSSIVREHLQNNLIEDETLKRLLLTDNTGQHKDVKNKARTGRLCEEVEYVEVQNEDRDILFEY